MTRETVLQQGRDFLDQALSDTCLIDREDETLQTTNTTTGMVTRTYVTVYSGPCEVKQGGGAEAGQTLVGEAAQRVGSFDIKLPVVGTEGLRPDDRVTITASLNDAELVGRRFWLTGEAHASHKTTRRISMSELED